MKRENLAIIIAVASFIFWIAQNFYFGWNKEAQSALEAFCDGLVIFGFFIAYMVKPSAIETTVHIYNGDLKIGKKN